MKRFAKILAAIGSLLLLFAVGGIVSLAQIVNNPDAVNWAAESAPKMWFLLTRTGMIWPLIIALVLLIGAAVISIVQWRKRVRLAKAEKEARKAEREARKKGRHKDAEAESDEE